MINMDGQHFGRWTVLRVDPNRSKGKGCITCWICECSCGTVRAVQGFRLRKGRSKSCGCLARETLKVRMTRHSDSKTPEYYAWQQMVQRCENQKNRRFKDYGGRGITVCDTWHSYENFLTDMGRRPSRNHSLDRIDNDEGYSPINCRWATREKQRNNIRVNRHITYRGVTHTLSEWSSSTGIHKATISGRLDRRGWTIGQALGFQCPP
jgi:hypothetical protein